jgi:hypothetical protein
MQTVVNENEAAWPTQGQTSRIRVRPLTATLAVVLVAAAGIYGGATLEKRHGSAAGATAVSGAGTGATGFASRAGATGGPGGTFGGTGGTSGTVTQVTAKTLYLTSSAGKLVKVKLTAKTTFTRTAKSATGGLKLGDTAIVRGTKNAAGTVVATSVIATAKGVTTTFGAPGGQAAP